MTITQSWQIILYFASQLSLGCLRRLGCWGPDEPPKRPKGQRGEAQPFRHKFSDSSTWVHAEAHTLGCLQPVPPLKVSLPKVGSIISFGLKGSREQLLWERHNCHYDVIRLTKKSPVMRHSRAISHYLGNLLLDARMRHYVTTVCCECKEKLIINVISQKSPCQARRRPKRRRRA